MAKALYDSVSGVARKVKKKYDGVSGVARKVTKAYDGVNAIARQFFQSGSPIGNLAVGTSVYMNVNGWSKEFIIVHQGTPSSVYDSSCNDTWLLMKDLYTKRKFDSTDNDYANSDIHTYLNGTFLGLFESGIQSIVKQVKIPYHNGTGSSGSVLSGSNGLSTKVFLLSCYEVGWTTTNNSNVPVEGALLSYFTSGSGTSAKNKRVAYYNEEATYWVLRSPHIGYTNRIFGVSTDGSVNYNTPTYSLGVRPALILPSTTLVDGSFDIVA